MKVPALGSVYTKRQHQRSDDATDAVPIEINGVTPEWVATPF